MDLKDYKFALVDGDRTTRVYEEMDQGFFGDLMESQMNQVIASKNMDLDALAETAVFNEWFTEYANSGSAVFFRGGLSNLGTHLGYNPGKSV